MALGYYPDVMEGHASRMANLRQRRTNAEEKKWNTAQDLVLQGIGIYAQQKRQEQDLAGRQAEIKQQQEFTANQNALGRTQQTNLEIERQRNQNVMRLKQEEGENFRESQTSKRHAETLDQQERQAGIKTAAELAGNARDLTKYDFEEKKLGQQEKVKRWELQVDLLKEEARDVQQAVATGVLTPQAGDAQLNELAEKRAALFEMLEGEGTPAKRKELSEEEQAAQLRAFLGGSQPKVPQKQSPDETQSPTSPKSYTAAAKSQGMEASGGQVNRNDPWKSEKELIESLGRGAKSIGESFTKPPYQRLVESGDGRWKNEAEMLDYYARNPNELKKEREINKSEIGKRLEQRSVAPATLPAKGTVPSTSQKPGVYAAQLAQESSPVNPLPSDTAANPAQQQQYQQMAAKYGGEEAMLSEYIKNPQAFSLALQGVLQQRLREMDSRRIER